MRTIVDLRAPADVVHIVAHGDSTTGEVGFFSEDEGTILLLETLAERYRDSRPPAGIAAAAILADACGTASGAFKKAIRDCLSESTVYIGTRRSVSWHQGSTFASAFYAAYFRSRGKGVSALARAQDAALRAADAHEVSIGRCPFVIETLQPSPSALRSFG